MTRQKKSKDQNSGYKGDTASISSESSLDSTASQNSLDEVVDLAHVLDENLDLLTEKRYTVREAAWEKVNKIFKMNFLEEMIAGRQETLTDLIARAVRKGTEKEALLAASCTGILAITLGPGAQPFVNTISPVFAEIVKDRSRAPTIRTAIIQASVIVMFVCSSEPTDTAAWLEIFAALFEEEDAVIREAALDAWCLLASSLSDGQVANELLPAAIVNLVSMLQDSDVDVKVAAGKAIALLIEASKDHKEASEESFDIELLSDDVDVIDLIEVLTTLSDGYTKYQSKKEKQKQRNVFRDILRYVSEWDSPSELLSIKHQKFTFEGWGTLTQLNAFRELLGTGLQIHLEMNTVLADILSVQVQASTPKKNMNAVEKRLFQSPNSAQAKAQTRSLARGRAQRHAAITCGDY